jgi:hypothetical protein
MHIDKQLHIKLLIIVHTQHINTLSEQDLKFLALIFWRWNYFFFKF